MTDFNTALQELEAELKKYLTFCKKNQKSLSKDEIKKAQKMAALLKSLPKEVPALASNATDETKTEQGSFAEKMAKMKIEFEALKAKIEGNTELNELLSNLKNS